MTNIQEAIDHLKATYREAFGEEPDGVALQIISMNSPKVLRGENWVWKRDGGYMKLVKE